jgi:hypothetical protein
LAGLTAVGWVPGRFTASGRVWVVCRLQPGFDVAQWIAWPHGFSTVSVGPLTDGTQPVPYEIRGDAADGLPGDLLAQVQPDGTLLVSA